MAHLLTSFTQAHLPLVAFADALKFSPQPRIMADHPLQSYPLAILRSMGKQEGVMENPPLGTARRLGTKLQLLLSQRTNSCKP